MVLSARLCTTVKSTVTADLLKGEEIEGDDDGNICWWQGFMRMSHIEQSRFLKIF
jgi:hypothetical protein